MELKATITYQQNEDAYREGKSIIAHQGGSRSGKTYNTLEWLIIKAKKEWHNYVIDIVRDTMTSLRISAMFDFFQILEQHGWYFQRQHNKSQNTYKIGSNIFRFIGADEDQKVRGPGRHILFCNEVNGMKYKTFKQLNQRTMILVIMDFNPSEEQSWVYDLIDSSKDCAFFITTFRDNPFIPNRIRKEIYKYKETDPNYWRIYGLGERGVAEATIYRNWSYAIDRNGAPMTFDKFEGQRVFGMDFGYNDPTTLVRMKYHEKGGIFAEELMYKTELTSEQIIQELDKLRENGKITYDDQIIADAARPEIIEDIKRAGYNIRKAKKESGSILRGINFIKRHKVYMPKESTNLVREFRGYQWKVNKDERVLDTPVDLNDHLLDAMRYGLERLSRHKKKIGCA